MTDTEWMGGWCVPADDDNVAHYLLARSGDLVCGQPVMHRTWRVAAFVEQAGDRHIRRCTQCEMVLTAKGG